MDINTSVELPSPLQLKFKVISSALRVWSIFAYHKTWVCSWGFGLSSLLLWSASGLLLDLKLAMWAYSLPALLSSESTSSLLHLALCFLPSKSRAYWLQSLSFAIIPFGPPEFSWKSHHRQTLAESVRKSLRFFWVISSPSSDFNWVDETLSDLGSSYFLASRSSRGTYWCLLFLRRWTTVCRWPVCLLSSLDHSDKRRSRFYLGSLEATDIYRSIPSCFECATFWTTQGTPCSSNFWYRN